MHATIEFYNRTSNSRVAVFESSLRGARERLAQQDARARTRSSSGAFTREKIKKVELVYSIDPMDAYFAPYYRFYVELDRSPAAGFKCYGEFDVPAVNSKYIAN